MKRPWPCLLFMLALVVPAAAETPSKACLAAIKAADLHHRARGVPGDCWRIGPLHLGMSLAQARTLLGAPGASQNLTLTYHRRKYPVTRLYYVYPRNLKNWLRLAPARQADFHPVALRLDFSKTALVAIAVGNDAAATPPLCHPSVAGRGFVRGGADFPYGFHGLRLGAPLASVEARFGRFATAGHARQTHAYWPVPFSVDGDDVVSGVQFATGMAFAGEGGLPDFRLRLDPRSCYVTGFTLAPG